MAQVGGSGADLIGDIRVQLHARLVGDSRKMKHAVGGAAQGHIHGQGVDKRLFCHNVAGTDVLAVHLHHLHSGVLRKLDPLGVHRRDGAVAPKAHAQHLGQTVHAVGRVHAGAGTAGGTGFLLELPHVLLAHGARRVGAHCLEHAGKAGLVALHMARQHGAAADEHGGHVDSGRSHQKAGHVLVAVGHHHQGVELVSQCHTLGGIRDQVPGHQGILHAHVAHGDAVADRDGREHHRGAARHGHAQLHRFHDLIQVHVSGYNFIIRTHNAHHGLFHLFRRHAEGVEQGPVGRLLHTCFHCITFHLFLLLYRIRSATRSPMRVVPTFSQPSDIMSPVR